MVESAIESKAFVLLIDDEDESLNALAEHVRIALRGSPVKVEAWQPVDNQDAVARFNELTVDPPLMVVTDYDLTRGGLAGLFGPSIVALAQRRAIPVGDYSRKPEALTTESDVFEFRIPSDPIKAGPMIASIALGFLDIAGLINARNELIQEHSPAALLADLLGRPQMSGPFALYSSRIATGNSALVQLLRNEVDPSPVTRACVATYVLGHLLFNSILRFPGPIMHRDALCAYIAASQDEGEAVASLFKEARYRGPFAKSGDYFWQDDVDDYIETLASESRVEYNGSVSFDSYRRTVVETRLQRTMKRHDCTNRCHGERGGYWCPFSKRPVCDRDDCSVAASSWIPEGASLCRVERDFFDEWAPLMGL